MLFSVQIATGNISVWELTDYSAVQLYHDYWLVHPSTSVASSD